MDIRKKLFLLCTSNIFASLVGFLTIVYLARYFAPSVFGIYQLCISIVLFISSLSAFKYDMAIIIV